MHVDPAAQSVEPVHPVPPHCTKPVISRSNAQRIGSMLTCPYFVTAVPLGAGAAVVDATVLVLLMLVETTVLVLLMVVGATEVDAADVDADEAPASGACGVPPYSRRPQSPVPPGSTTIRTSQLQVQGG